jgi:HD-GYP domain-containing protein (c-di-GMP phosphodiesterase class II)
MSRTQPAERRDVRPSWKRHWPALLTVFCGLAFSLSVFYVLHAWESRDIRDAFWVESANRATAVKQVFESHISRLESVQAAFNGMPQINRGEFDKLLAPFQAAPRIIVAVEWVPRVADADRARYEAAARRDGIKGFQFTEQDSRGRIVRSVRRDEYFPIYYIGPGAGNPAVFGYDLASEAARFEALSKARDTGKTQASGRIAFIQDEKIGNGFLILAPVYEPNKPLARVEDRRRYFRGIVCGVFHPDTLIEAAMSTLPSGGIDVALFDSATADGKKPFYFHASRDVCVSPAIEFLQQCDDPHLSRFRSELEVAGQHWTVECAAIPEFVASRQSWWPWTSLAAGAAFTAMMAAYVMMSLDRRAYAERLVHEKRVYARELEAVVNARTRELKSAQEETIERLVTASLWRDEETGMHIRRTGLFCEALGKAAGWSEAEVEIFRQAAFMHDVGKIGIPDAILRKPGKLTPKEFEIIKTHTLIGAEMLGESKTPILRMAREIALYHHEHWDGRGYPTGIAGLRIPESARIMAIADVYDALTHDRVYRPAFTEEESLEMMSKESGTHFDPSLLALFFTIQPEISRLSQEYPDDACNERKLSRDFAAILAGTSATEDEVLQMAASNSPL